MSRYNQTNRILKLLDLISVGRMTKSELRHELRKVGYPICGRTITRDLSFLLRENRVQIEETPTGTRYRRNPAI
jgi:hypothetical protein